MKPEQVMKLIDAHVKASVENFAGQRRDTTITRQSIVLALAQMVAIPALTSEVPQASPQKSKRARIFGG